MGRLGDLLATSYSTSCGVAIRYCGWTVFGAPGRCAEMSDAHSSCARRKPIGPNGHIKMRKMICKQLWTDDNRQERRKVFFLQISAQRR